MSLMPLVNHWGGPWCKLAILNGWHLRVNVVMFGIWSFVDIVRRGGGGGIRGSVVDLKCLPVFVTVTKHLPLAIFLLRLEKKGLLRHSVNLRPLVWLNIDRQRGTLSFFRIKAKFSQTTIVLILTFHPWVIKIFIKVEKLQKNKI